MLHSPGRLHPDVEVMAHGSWICAVKGGKKGRSLRLWSHVMKKSLRRPGPPTHLPEAAAVEVGVAPAGGRHQAVEGCFVYRPRARE